MFGFLKDKIKSAISKISKKVEDEAPQEDIEVESSKKKAKKEEPKKGKPKQEVKTKKKYDKKKVKEEIKEWAEKVPEEEDVKTIEEEIVPKEEITEEKEEIKEEPKEEKKGFFSKLKDKFIHKEEEIVPKEEIKVKEKEPEEKKGFFSAIKEKITTTKISEDKFEELFYDLELGLLESNVAFEVVEKIKQDLKNEVVEKQIKRGEVEEAITEALKESIEDLFLVEKIDLFEKIKSKKPYVICFVGINGSGKTTSIAKVAHLIQKNKKSVVLAAADTFRAAAIQQLKEWGNRLNIKVIAHDYGSDPAAVSFDAIKYAEAHGIDVVLIDTAGRLHSNKDLMREMEKIARVAKPDLKIFVGEAITGGDCINQAQEFNKTIGIDGIILSKADVDEKGGAMVSVSYVTHKPIIYLGVGQEPDDLKEFNKEEIVKGLGL